MHYVKLHACTVNALLKRTVNIKRSNNLSYYTGTFSLYTHVYNKESKSIIKEKKSFLIYFVYDCY